MIDCYNKKINIPNSILLLMEDIWNLSQGLNIYVYRHFYRKGNKIADYLTKKGLNSLDYNIIGQIFLKMLQISTFMISVVFIPIVFLSFLFHNLLSYKKKKTRAYCKMYKICIAVPRYTIQSESLNKIQMNRTNKIRIQINKISSKYEVSNL